MATEWEKVQDSYEEYLSVSQEFSMIGSEVDTLRKADGRRKGNTKQGTDTESTGIQDSETLRTLELEQRDSRGRVTGWHPQR